MTPALKWLLVAVAVAMIAVAGSLAYREQTTQNPDPGVLLFPQLMSRLNDVNAFSLLRDGQLIEVRRGEAGEWVVASKDDYPAAFALVKQALLQIAEMRAMSPAANDLASLVRNGLTPPNLVRVTLKAADGKALADFDLGGRSYATTPDGPLSQTYARLAGTQKVWLVRPAPDLPREARNWLDDGLLSIDRDRIRHTVLTRPNGAKLAVIRETPRDMDFKIENLSEYRRLTANPTAGAANGVGLALANLRFEDVAPEAQVDFTKAGAFECSTFDGLTIGGQIAQADGQYWVRLQASYTAPPPPEEGSAVVMPAAPADGAAEAEDLNKRFQGWAFRLPDVKGHDLTRTLADLIGG